MTRLPRRLRTLNFLNYYYGRVTLVATNTSVTLQFPSSYDMWTFLSLHSGKTEVIHQNIIMPWSEYDKLILS